MSIEPDRDQFFQYATFGIIGLTVVVCLCYALIFVNPNANLISSLRPIPPTPTVAALSLPATWTPTFTPTQTNTPTEEPTDTPTATPTNTPTRTNTFIPTFTPLPTLPPATSRPPTQKPPPTNPPPPPPPPTATPIPATATPQNRTFATKNQGCDFGKQTYVAGTVWADWSGSGTLSGMRIRISASPNGSAAFPDAITNSGGTYKIVLNSSGSKPGTWYVWVVGLNGNPSSIPGNGKFTTNKLGSNNAGACWIQTMDFVRQ